MSKDYPGEPPKKSNISMYYDALARQKRHIVYMDGIDFEHHMDSDSKGVKAYKSQKDCIQGEACLRGGAGCGVVKLEVRLLEWVVEPIHDKGKSYTIKELEERERKTAKARALHIRPGLRCEEFHPPVYNHHFRIFNEDQSWIASGDTEELAWIAALKTKLNRRGRVD